MTTERLSEIVALHKKLEEERSLRERISKIKEEKTLDAIILFVGDRSTTIALKDIPELKQICQDFLGELEFKMMDITGAKSKKFQSIPE